MKRRDLIDTLWNVKKLEWSDKFAEIKDLIDTLWNVKTHIFIRS